MKQGRRASSIVLAAAVAVGLAACGSSGKSEGKSSGKKLNIAFVGADLPDPFYLTQIRE